MHNNDKLLFVDEVGRHITIGGDDYFDFKAIHNGIEIGSIGFGERDDQVYLASAEVRRDYQNAGIATELMRLAVKVHGKHFERPEFTAVGGSNAAAETYYTPEGAGLIRRCIRLKILDDDTPHYADGLDGDEFG